MPEKIYNVAVIGVSGMGRHHALSAVENPHTDLYAVCDLIPANIEKACALPGANVKVTTDDYKSLVSDPKVDISIVVTPDGMCTVSMSSLSEKPTISVTG